MNAPVSWWISNMICRKHIQQQKWSYGTWAFYGESSGKAVATWTHASYVPPTPTTTITIETPAPPPPPMKMKMKMKIKFKGLRHQTQYVV